MRWKAKFIVKAILSRSYREYKVMLELDETPYTKRINELQAEFDGTLFKDDLIEKKHHQEKINEMKKQLERLQDDCEYIEFVALVDEIKYKDGFTHLLLQIPDDIVEPFNRQKTRFDIYKLSLVPVI